MNLTSSSLFHIHTYRCGHAAFVPDEAYVREAIRLGADSIWFSDHAPFPGDPFGNRMSMSELDEYLETILSLKSRYAGRIEVHVGLEAEYFPSFDRSGYYRDLKNETRIEFLLLGQHMAEHTPGHYTFDWDDERLDKDEYKALGEAVIKGIESGYYTCVAHPDRIFRRRRAWDPEMAEMSKRIIAAARAKDIPLELNMHSADRTYQFWPEFWELLSPENRTVVGLDAHAPEELERRFCLGRQYRR